ncbi:MAG: alpha/beta hydrolase [Muribaculum sp.]|nr:alpha/beta hydrolase [Ruminococcus flavefaciens]MCM1373636.1 alpha/beta hydrolase [Muribaculum sp.]
MVRLYGSMPYQVVLVHGGPGAIGSLKGFAQELNELSQIGVVEAIQSKYSIAELIEELYDQIRENCDGKISLVGHSWGAWLVALFAEKHPELIERIILIGSGPLEDKYVSDIGARRFQNLSEEDGAIFQRLIDKQATDEDMEKIPKVFEQSDNYCLVDKDKHKADKTDSEMHNKVWSEAARLRTSGELLTSFKKIKSDIFLIQGNHDPHPAKGVTIPLQENDVSCEAYILDKCGHSPFMEKYAKEEFYRILIQIITSSGTLTKS